MHWAWGAQQRRQAPDAREFRIYLHPGSQLADPAVAVNWAQRIAVVGLGEQILPSSVQPLQTPPPNPQNLVGQSVSISGAQVTLLDGPSIDTVRAGEAELELVVNSVGNQFAVLNVDAQNRVITVDRSVQDIGAVSAWALLPLRQYELFLPGTTLATPPAFTSPPPPPRSAPVAYSLVGVSAADDKDRDDLRQGNQPLTPRPGNEGAVGGPATVIQILRTPPNPPPAPFGQDTLSATRADFMSRSFFTLHAVKKPTAQDPAMAVHVYRALDDALLQVDSSRRFPTAPTPPSASPTTSVKASDLGWDVNRFNNAASEIAALTADKYNTLSPNALRLLASLPSNAAAFGCVTRAPLPADTNDDCGFRPADVRPGCRAPTLLWRSPISSTVGRRTSTSTAITLVDAAQNQSALGASTPPVLLPPTAVPHTVQFTRVEGGDFAITLAWPDVADPGITAYRLFKTDDPNKTHTVLAMAPFPSTFAAGSGSQGTITFVDRDVQPLKDYFYRLVAIGPTNVESPPSDVARGRAIRVQAAAPPVITSVTPITSPVPGFQVNWDAGVDLAVLVQRNAVGVPGWSTLGTWQPAGTASFVDTSVQAGVVYQYRLRGRDASGIQTDLSDPVSTGTA